MKTRLDRLTDALVAAIRTPAMIEARALVDRERRGVDYRRAS